MSKACQFAHLVFHMIIFLIILILTIIYTSRSFVRIVNHYFWSSLFPIMLFFDHHQTDHYYS
jgi:hypothetical protein